jgi:hypothetical protein
MHVVVFLASGLLILMMLAEFFISFLLPRRVKRDPRIARRVLVSIWLPWRALARRLPPQAADTLLGMFGPGALLVLVGVWSFGLILGFAGLNWGVGSALVAHGATRFADNIYFSASAFFNVSTTLAPYDNAAKALRIAEAATGYMVLFVVIGYLPSLFQAFSRREVPVSMMDARAGSPPSASRLLQRSGHLGGWADLDEYLADWEIWAAELMETHLSYPILGYFRSQHVNQNWLATLTTVLDTSAFAIAFAPASTPAAELTFAICRHALADLASSFRAKPLAHVENRLDANALERMCAIAAEASLELAEGEQVERQLAELRAMYEPYAFALSRRLELPLPEWVDDGGVENWRQTAWHSRRAGAFH